MVPLHIAGRRAERQVARAHYIPARVYAITTAIAFLAALLTVDFTMYAMLTGDGAVPYFAAAIVPLLWDPGQKYCWCIVTSKRHLQLCPHDSLSTKNRNEQRHNRTEVSSKTEPS